MAIREAFRKAMRSDASGTSQPEPNSNMTTATSSTKTSVSSKSSESKLKLTRTWTWGSSTKQEPKERKPKNKTKTKKRIVHPSEKPLTAQNLMHQEMLSQFTWTFGASRPDQVESESFIGISPCCTRAPSLVDFDGSTDTDQGSSSSSSVSEA